MGPEEQHQKKVDELKKELKEKEEEFKQQAVALKKKYQRQNIFMGQLVSKMRCPVCMEVPHRGPVPVCPNGHFVCSHCITETCPSCSVVMGEGRSQLSTFILGNVEHKCKFDDCEENIPLDYLDEHEASCLHRTVNCPVSDILCTEKVSLSKLVQHMLASDCCRNDTAPDETLPGWNRINLFFTDMNRKQECLSASLFTFAGESYAIFVLKLEEDFFVVPVMLSKETECSKYRIEMIIHGREADALESKVSAGFQGSFFSIDEEKKCMEMYGTTQGLMKKIVKKEGEKYKFSLSFKISAEE